MYLSADQTVGGDSLLADGVSPPLEGNGEVVYSFDDFWPNVSGEEYYIIAEIDSVDDSDDSDNVYVSSPYVTYDLLEVEPNHDFGPTGVPLVNVHDLGQFSGATTLCIWGQLDGGGTYDTFKFQLPADTAGTDTLTISAVWSTGTDALDLYLWDESNNTDSSTKTTPDKESKIEATGFAGDHVGYIGVSALEADSRYYLIIEFTQP